MKKLIGFIAFWIAVGMLLMLLIPYDFLGVLIMVLLLLAGYNLYFLKC